MIKNQQSKSALVIGGTSGVGAAIAEELNLKGYTIVVVGRSLPPALKFTFYQCDVLNSVLWQKKLKKIVKEHRQFDMVVFVVGYARATDANLIEWNKHLQGNLLYVIQGMEILRSVIKPLTKIITIGSQWSHKKGNNLLAPYIVSKHALRAYTENLSEIYKTGHYCVPPLDTEQRKKVLASFEKLQRVYTTSAEIKPGIVGSLIVAHALSNERTGKTYVVEQAATVNELQS